MTADEDDGEEGPIRVCVIIPGLKRKMFNNQEASNGSVTFKPEERFVMLYLDLLVNLVATFWGNFPTTEIQRELQNKYGRG